MVPVEIESQTARPNSWLPRSVNHWLYVVPASAGTPPSGYQVTGAAMVRQSAQISGSYAEGRLATTTEPVRRTSDPGACRSRGLELR